MKIYIAGPLTNNNTEGSGNIGRNVLRAMSAGYEVLKRGHFPFIPHLTYYFADWLEREKELFLPWDTYMEWDHEYLKDCDALLYLGSSRGADEELSWAQEAGKIIFFTLEEIPEEKISGRCIL